MSSFQQLPHLYWVIFMPSEEEQGEVRGQWLAMLVV